VGQHHGRGQDLRAARVLDHPLPGLFLAATVLAINLVGDGLRELLDVRG
jgi:ABC-type dipeptide/oligopeptide/nickel transport system permease subunit